MDLFTKFKQFLQSTQLHRASSDVTPASQDHVMYKRVSSDSDEAKELVQDDSHDKSARSIDDILDDIGLRLIHIKLFVLFGFLNITDSLEVSMLSVILPSVKSDLGISALLTGILTLSLSSGMICGGVGWGWVSDKYGRKPSFIGSVSFIIVFALTSALSHNYYMLWISLFLVGFGVGTITQVFVMFTEVFPPKYRLLFSGLINVFWTIGFLLSALVSTELSAIGYHVALAIVCVPTGIFLLGIVFLPDTPHYVLAAGDEQKAVDILQRLAPEMDLSNTTLKHTNVVSKRADITQLFRSGYWKITSCAFIVAFSSCTVYYSLVYTASDVASGHGENTTSASFDLAPENKLVYTSSGNLYSIMAWMNLPEFLIIILVATGCHIFPLKNVLLTVFVVPIVLLTVALIVLNQRHALLVVTILSRSFGSCVVFVFWMYASLIYPTENRSIGVGACVSIGRVGTLLGPFIFEALFEKSYLEGILFNFGMLLLGFIATILLPSPSTTIID